MLIVSGSLIAQERTGKGKLYWFPPSLSHKFFYDGELPVLKL